MTDAPQRQRPARETMARALFKADWPKSDWDKLGPGEWQRRYLTLADVAISENALFEAKGRREALEEAAQLATNNGPRVTYHNPSGKLTGVEYEWVGSFQLAERLRALADEKERGA